MARLQVNCKQTNLGWNPSVNWLQMGASGPLLNLTAGGNIQGNALYTASRVNSKFNLIDISGASSYEFYLYLLGGIHKQPGLSGKAMTIDWPADLPVTGVTVPGGGNLLSVVVDLANHKATFVLGTLGNYKVRLVLNSAAGNPDGTVPIRVYETAKAAYLGQFWDPDWVAFHGKFATLRLMDIMGINNSAVTSLADFPQTGQMFPGYTTTGINIGVPVSAIIELANRIPGKVWVNIPHQMTDAAITALAAALLAGTTYVGNEVKYVFEWSNELWNSIFSQTASKNTGFCYIQGNVGGGNFDAFGYAGGWESSTTFTNGQQYIGYRMAQAAELVRAAFGQDSGQKYQFVLGSQGVNPGVTTTELFGINHHLSADSPPVGTTIAKLFSAIAVAPYPGPVVTTVASDPGLSMLAWALVDQATFNANFDAKINAAAPSSSSWLSLAYWRTAWLGHKTIADANGLGMCCYEASLGPYAVVGGADQTTINNAIFGYTQSKLGAQTTKDMVDLFFADTGGEPSAYFIMGSMASSGPWAGYETTDDWASERGSAYDAFNLGIPYVQGKHGLRVALTA